MNKFVDVENIQLNIKKNTLLEAAIKLMNSSISKADFQSVFQIEPIEYETIFDALIRSGKTANIYDAAVIIGRKMPPGEGVTWNELAKWIVEYEQYNDILFG
jgi:hypothetical protein